MGGDRFSYTHKLIQSYTHACILPYCHTVILPYCHTAIPVFRGTEGRIVSKIREKLVSATH